MTDSVKKIFKNVLENHIPMIKFIGVKVLELDAGYVKLLFPYREGQGSCQTTGTGCRSSGQVIEH